MASILWRAFWPRFRGSAKNSGVLLVQLGPRHSVEAEAAKRLFADPRDESTTDLACDMIRL
jgi:hypothetical protein